MEDEEERMKDECYMIKKSGLAAPDRVSVSLLHHYPSSFILPFHPFSPCRPFLKNYCWIG
jgi:hypothetical protein